MTPLIPQTHSPGPTDTGRLVSLDVFRGATIAWMILVNSVIHGGPNMGPFAHGKWNQITPTDWVFPFFLFIMGVAMPFSFARWSGDDNKPFRLYARMIRRMLLLFLLGWLTHLTPDFNWRELRVLGTLPRLGLCYLIVGMIVLHFGRRTQLQMLAALLLSYWALMVWVPFPGKAEFAWASGDNLAQYIDRLVLGVHMQRPNNLETKGILSTLPAIAITLAGCQCGAWIRTRRHTGLELTNGLFVCGTAGMILSLFWYFWVPFGQALWTPSYALFVTALAMLVLATAYWAIEIKGCRFGVRFCTVFGANAILAYTGAVILSKLIPTLCCLPLDGKYVDLRRYIYEGFLAPLAGRYCGSMLWAILCVAFWWCICAFLYRKRIFLRV